MSGEATPLSQESAETLNTAVEVEQSATADAAPEAEAPATEAAASADPEQRVRELEAELEALKAEHETVRSQYMRIAADFDNFRKRQSRDQDDLRVQIACTTLSEILPVVDNF